MLEQEIYIYLHNAIKWKYTFYWSTNKGEILITWPLDNQDLCLIQPSKRKPSSERYLHLECLGFEYQLVYLWWCHKYVECLQNSVSFCITSQLRFRKPQDGRLLTKETLIFFEIWWKQLSMLEITQIHHRKQLGKRQIMLFNKAVN